jgi:hypothetical protein
MPMSHVKSMRRLSFESRIRFETNFALLRRAIATYITLGPAGSLTFRRRGRYSGHGRSKAMGSVRRC